MKYFLKALLHELGGFLLIAILAGIVYGVIKLVYYLAGDDYAPGVLLLLLLAVIQIRITWDRAQTLKRRDGK